MVMQWQFSEHRASGWAYQDWRIAREGVGAEAPNDPEVSYFLILKDSERPASEDIAKQAAEAHIKLLIEIGLRVSDYARQLYANALIASAKHEQAPIPRLIAFGEFSHHIDDRLTQYFLIDHVGGVVPEFSNNLDVYIDRKGSRTDIHFGVIIDDGLPILSKRYSDRDGTRFHAVWLQTLGLKDNHFLTKADIDNVLSHDEAASYRALNRTYLDADDHASTNHATSHGAAVTDLAFGPDCYTDTNTGESLDEAGKLPLIGVQLPPKVIADSTGQAASTYLVAGLSWAVVAAFHCTTELGDKSWPGHLYVNLSVGSLAGPDGKNYLADWLDYLADLYQVLSGYKMYISCAYGNAYRSQLVARGMVGNGNSVDLDWRVQPDDHSSSGVEIRGMAPDDILQVTTPAGHRVKFAPRDAKNKVLIEDKTVLAMISRFDHRTDEGVMVFVAPTASHVGRQSLAPAGAWKLSVTSRSKDTHKVSLKIQRDDTPGGYRRLGRQSYFDHPDAHGWDEETRDWSLPDTVTCPIQRTGTTVSHAGAERDTIRFVAARLGTTRKGRRQPSLYSSAGNGVVDQSGISGPHYDAVADETANRHGISAAGILSRSRTRLSGTSAAAPIATRMIVEKNETEQSLRRPVGPVPPRIGLRKLTLQCKPCAGNGSDHSD